MAIPDFGLRGGIQYAKEKSIGIWLYVNLQGLYSWYDSLFAIYEKRSAKELKFLALYRLALIAEQVCFQKLKQKRYMTMIYPGNASIASDTKEKFKK